MSPYHTHKSKVLDLISMPLIWSVFIPAFIIDVWVELYHRICFPLYGLPYIKRSKYIRLDRHTLKMLHPLERLGCVYCGYFNGLMHYITVIAAETEKYWCAIKHTERGIFAPPAHHDEFYVYGSDDIRDRNYYTKKHQTKV